MRRDQNPGVLLLFGGLNISPPTPLVEIGLTDLPKTGGGAGRAKAPTPACDSPAYRKIIFFSERKGFQPIIAQFACYVFVIYCYLFFDYVIFKLNNIQ